MLREPFHLSDEDILLVVDGEVSGRRARQARAHLTACWLCRSRLGQLEGTIADFVTLHRHTLDPKLPPASGSRALLKARIAEAAALPSALAALASASLAAQAAGSDESTVTPFTAVPFTIGPTQSLNRPLPSLDSPFTKPAALQASSIFLQG